MHVKSKNAIRKFHFENKKTPTISGKTPTSNDSKLVLVSIPPDIMSFCLQCFILESVLSEVYSANLRETSS